MSVKLELHTYIRMACCLVCLMCFAARPSSLRDGEKIPTLSEIKS